MTENTKVQWADHTFNPWIGCEKISPACHHCYAATRSKRVGEPQLWEGQRRRTTVANWREPLRWNAKAAAAGTRHRVFCASLADVFDNVVPDEWRADLFTLIRATPHLDWLLLTKRIGNARQMLPDDWGFGPHRMQNGYKNVWLGATFGNQNEWDRDAEKLFAIPARIRFASLEPLLSPIDLGLAGTLPGDAFPGYQMVHDMINWIIVGGESGPRARQLHVLWVTHLQRQCREANVPIFIKQLGRFPIAGSGDAVTMRDAKGGDMSEWPDSMRIRQFPTAMQPNV